MTENIPARRTTRRVHTGPGDQRRLPPTGLTPPPPEPPRIATDHGGDAATQSTSSLSEAHADRLEAELSTKTANLALKARQIDAAIRTAAIEEADRVKVQIELAKRHAGELRTSTTSQVRSATEERRAAITSALGELAQVAAPAPFGVGFTAEWTALESGRAGAPELVRRGSTHTGPALYPLYHDMGWYLDGPPRETITEIHTQVLRAVAGLPLKHLRIDVFDPRIEGRLGGFAPLRSAHSAAFPTPTTSAPSFRATLDDVTRSAATNAEAIATEQVKTLGELWKVRGVPSGEYRVVVVLNYPEGIDREAQGLLVRLARSGGPNGVSLLVQHDAAAEPSDDAVRVEDLARHLHRSRIDENGELLLSGYPTGVDVTSDGAAPSELVKSVIAAATDRATSDTGPVVPLEDLIGADVQNPWTGDSSEGLEATIARVGQRNLSIALRSQNPPISNVLVGGAVGQGKSNLLLDIIYALTSRYSPADLELHLLDFKQGLEFQRFAADENGQNWLPHARVLSLESDRPFGVAVLRNVVLNLTKRAVLFKESGASGIEDYQRKSGSKLPRLLLIIDEFQVLFEGDDHLVTEAVELIETISRQGRAAGVHLLLSSQTTSGVSGLRVKGESIFAQFPLRISLKNTATESEALLSQGNKAAAELTYRGEIIVNRNFGLDPEGSNERAISAFAEPAFIEGLQRRLWQLQPGGTGPLVFVSTAFAAWPDIPIPEPQDGSARGLLGRPVEVTNEPVELSLDDDIDQSIAIVGSDESLAAPALAGLARSVASSARPSLIVVIDLSASSDESAGTAIAPVLDELDQRGFRIERYGRPGAGEVALRTIHTAAQQSDSKTLVLGIGLQRWTGLDDARPVNPDNADDFETFTLREGLEDLVRRGALNGVYFVGWWTTLSSLQEQLGYSCHGIRHFVTTKLGLEEYRSLTSHAEPAIQGYPRVGYIDRSSDGGPRVVVPFEFVNDVIS